MKKALTIAMAAAAFAATVSLVIAGGSKRASAIDAGALSGNEIVAIVRAMGLDPIGEPMRRGPYFVLHAYNPRGIEMRVVADVKFGDVLSVAPAGAINTAYAPHYERGPRIIHVPRASNERTGADPRDEPATTNKGETEEAVPPPKPRRAVPKPRVEMTPKPQRPRNEVAPKPQRRSDAPPPPLPGPPRTILSAPPPPAEGPSPIRPLPRYKTNADSGEKFGPPRDPAINGGMPAEQVN